MIIFTLNLEPFHPEELLRQLLELERIFGTVPDSSHDARRAIGKAITSASAAFLEGSLDERIRAHLGKMGVPECVVDFVESRLSGLGSKRDFVVKRIAANKASTSISTNIEPFLQVRNKVDHGDVVSDGDLHLADIGWFRRTAIAYLQETFTVLGDPYPAWWS